MNLKQLSNEALEQNLVELFSKERSLLCVIILHVMEIERRKSYESSNTTLFEYLMKLSKYTHGTTQRRIDAAMLALELPEVLHAVKSGDLNQNQIICAQMGFRQSAKQNKKKVTTAVKLEVIKAIYGKTVAESEVIIAAMLGIKPKSRTTVKHQADGSVEIKTVYTKEDWALIDEAKVLLSHSVPSGAFNDLTTYMAKRVIAHKTKLATEKEKRQSVRESKSNTKEKSINSDTVVNHELKIPDGISSKSQSKPHEQKLCPPSKGFKQNYHLQRARKWIPAHIRRAVFAKYNCCQHTDPLTGKICGSRWLMQIDHIQPIWAGGTNEIENLRVLCGAHNRMVYRKQANLRVTKIFAP